MSKVLPLEGPHKKHHNHGKDDSVPKKGNGPAVPNEHWEKQYNPLPRGGNDPKGAFEPKCAKNRPTPHNKVNETDH